MGLRYLATLLLLPSLVAAQGVGGPHLGTPAGVRNLGGTTSPGGLPVFADQAGDITPGPVGGTDNDAIVYKSADGTWHTRTLDSTDFAVSGATGPTGAITNGANVTECGACVGNASCFCSTIDLAGKTVDGSSATTFVPRTGTSLPADDTCTPGDLKRIKGSATLVDRLCTCAAKPCMQTSDCGTGGTCTSNRCAAGSTKGRWQCTTAGNPLYGDGSDGAFFLPTPTGGTTCSVGSTPSTGAVCPTLCTSCTNVTGGNATAGCICTLSANSWLGFQGSTGTQPSVLRQLTAAWVGAKNRVTTNWAPSNDCGTAAGSTLWIKVQGDLTLEGDATTGATLDMKGKGACGGKGAGTWAAGVGGAGCATAVAGGAAGANTPAAGTAGSAAVLDALWLGRGPYQLFGAGGGKTSNSSGASCTDLSRVDDGFRGGGGSGGGGGVKMDATSGCAGTTGTPGHGGGGILLDIGGTLTLGAHTTLDTSASAGSGGGVGGAGGGSIVMRYGQGYSASGTTTFMTSGGTGGAGCGTGSGSAAHAAAGGAGGNGTYVAVPMP